MRSVLVSQIGYRPEDPLRIVVRGSPKDAADEVPLGLITDDGGRVELPPATRWGEFAGAVYWVADSGSLPEGTYRVLAEGAAESTPFAVASDVLREATLRATSIDTLASRENNKIGWQDCAFDGRGVESHAIIVLGLADLIDWSDSPLPPEYTTALRRGVDYLLACQRDDGSLMNEYYIARDKTVWTLVGLATSSLARAAVILSDGRVLDAAKAAWRWLIATTPDDAARRDELGTTRSIFGEYPPWVPPPERRARDVLLIIRAATDLYRGTNDLDYADIAKVHARDLRTRYQVRRTSTSERFGGFRAWPGSDVRQRGWEHAGWGFGCGAVLPDDVTGIISLLDLFPDSDEAALWTATLADFAYGQLVPACAGTPFGQYPLADLGDELRYFSPAWHGFNGMFGQIARTASELARVFDDPSLERIALDNLQWIAGANTGAPLNAADVDGAWTGLSWITGIGAVSAEGWSGIPGSIGNGFCATPQFRLEHLDEIVDGPTHRNAEDWLVHNGSWLSGLAAVSRTPRLTVRVTDHGHPVVAAQVTLTTAAGTTAYPTNARGIAQWRAVPRLTEIEVAVTAATAHVVRAITAVAGSRLVLAMDLDELFQVRRVTQGVAVTNETDGPIELEVVREGPNGNEVRVQTFAPGLTVIAGADEPNTVRVRSKHVEASVHVPAVGSLR